MSRTVRILAASAALLAVAAGAAIAQDFSANPTYATLNLATGFQPDPSVVNVQSGGNINAQNLNSSCQGFIANAPDVRVNYTAGNQYPLIISVAAQADTTLVVNGPDGQWYCDDDGGVNGLNPAVRNGYSGIRCTFKIRGDASPEKLAAIVEQSRARSAVFDVLTNGTKIDIAVNTQ